MRWAEHSLSTCMALRLASSSFLPLSPPKKKHRAKITTGFPAPEVPGCPGIFPGLCGCVICSNSTFLKSLAAYCLCFDPIFYLLSLFCLGGDAVPQHPSLWGRKDSVQGSHSSTIESYTPAHGLRWLQGAGSSRFGGSASSQSVNEGPVSRASNNYGIKNCG